MDPKWLSALRQEQAVKRKKKATQSSTDFHFRLYKEEQGIALRVVNASGAEVEIDYNESVGYERQLLSTLHQLKQQQDFVIDWAQPSNSIFLHEHPYLLALLRHCPRLENKKGESITFSTAKGRMVFQLDPKEDDQLEARHFLIVNEKRHADFVMLTEDMVLWEQQIIEVSPLGGGFAFLSVFNTTINKADEVFFLSLYFSQIDNIKLVYNQYELHQTEQLIEAEPCLVFEKIDVDQSLYLRVGQTLPHIDIDRMQDYPLVRYAQVNELEKRITLRVIRQNQYEDLLYSMERMLQKGRGKQQSFFREDNLFVLEQDCASTFITENLPKLLQSYRVLGAEQLKEYKITVQSPKVSMRLSHGIDFLEGEVDIDFGEQSIGLFDLLRQFQKQRYVVLGDGTTAIVDEHYVRRLERLFKHKDKEKKTLQLSVFDLPLIEDLIAEQTDQSPFKRSRAVFEGFADLAKKKTQLPKLNATMRPYQKYGFKWLNYLREQNLGGCLADDMGLGKTLQAISVLAKVYSNPEEKRPSLVVAPRSLLQNWRKECERFAPQLTTYIHYGTDRNWEATAGSQVVITTYATMRNDIKDLKDIDLCYVILDESQNIKNIETQTTRAVLLLQADHRLALSGTPIENNLGELYSLFRFLNPGMFGTLKQFMQDYGYPIQRENDAVATRHLRKKIFPFILRRHKEDVLDDLPDKVEQTLYVDMSPEQAQLYEMRRRYYQELIEQQVASKGISKSQFIIFQALNELRQIATIPESKTNGKVQSAKKELLLEQLWEVIGNGRKALIFVNFLAGLELLGNALDEQGVDYVSMSGATRNRQELVDRFQEDPSCRVFLMTLKTGGTGLNLTAASTVFIYDPWWNVAAEKQAIDRTHRIGQVNKVHALRLITVGTIEEKIRLLQEKKQELFDNVIGADGAAAKNITAEDIDFILGKQPGEMIQEDGNLGWKTSDVAEGFDELTKNDLSQTFWRLAVPFVKKERKLILSQLPAASAIYREWATYGNRSPQKSLMIKVCSLPFMSKSLYQRFVATLDPEVKTLMEYLALKGPLSHLMIEKELAITTYEKEYQEGGMHRYNRPSIKLLPQFRVLPYREPYSYYYGREAKIVFLLPKLLQKIVAILSSPIEARLPSYPELPDSAKKMNVFYGEELILRELPGLIIFLNNKRPKLSKKGRPNAASIRALGKKLALTEFYPATKQKELMHMRANMLASLLLQLDDLPNNASPPDLIKHLFAKTYPQQFRSALHLLTYVNGVSSLRAPAFRKVEHDSVEYFQPLYEQGWVEHKDWQHQKERTAYHIDFVEPRELNRLMLEVPGEFTSSSFSTTMEVAPFYGQKLIQWPILRAHLFLFAAWGLLDLVCEEPNCKGIGYTCDSPYDGVRYIRLTPLGAYVLGYTDEYESEITQPFELELSDDVLSILLTAGDMELASRAIASFARPVGSKRFQTNADMFLQDCNTAKDLKQKIDLFSTLFPGDLPSNWQTFFKELSQKANPLTEEEFLVFSINPNDQKLLQLLAQDEKIRELCSKAEGYRILVRTKDFKRLQKLLRAYGYLVE